MKQTLTAALLVSVNCGWASNGACLTDPSYTQVTSYGSGTTAGCYVADQTFSNFSSILHDNQTLGSVYLAAGDSGYTNGFGNYNTYAQFDSGTPGPVPFSSTNHV